MTGANREERIDAYYDEGTRDLGEWLVDAEDEIEMWKGVVRTLEAELTLVKSDREMLTRRVCRDAEDLQVALARVEELEGPRCVSCEHGNDIHDVDGLCWFTTATGEPGSDLVCPCKVSREGS